jgi:hypothetical protein
LRTYPQGNAQGILIFIEHFHWTFPSLSTAKDKTIPPPRSGRRRIVKGSRVAPTERGRSRPGAFLYQTAFDAIKVQSGTLANLLKIDEKFLGERKSARTASLSARPPANPKVPNGIVFFRNGFATSSTCGDFMTVCRRRARQPA